MDAPALEAEWRKEAERALKGRPLSALTSEALDGISLEPLYPRRAGPRPDRGDRSGWRVVQRVDHPEPDLANDQAHEDLDGGADALALTFAGAAGAYGFGVGQADPGTLARRLARIEPRTPLILDLGPKGVDEALAVAAARAPEGVDCAQLDVAFGLDPLGAAAREGQARPWSEEAEAAAAAVKSLRGRGFRGPFVAADGRTIHAAGATPAEELGAVLSAAIAYWKALNAHGLSLEEARDAIEFRLAADADELFTIAKFRALRLLWTRAQAAAGISPAPARVTAETAWRMASVRGASTNVMRGAIAAFSAGIGGADDVIVLPFTIAAGLPDAFARRLARNTSLVMLRESRLGFVEDAAAGSGVFEALTQALFEKGWAEMQAIEREGGLFSALANGSLRGRIRASAERLLADVRRRALGLTGVSLHADLDEAALKTTSAARPAFAVAGEIRFEPLAPLRLAAPFEALRDRLDALAAAGIEAKVSLIALGDVASRGARLDFARDAFASAGLRSDPLDASKTAKAAALACVCGPDSAYPQTVPGLVAALKAAGVRRVVVAGRPGEREAQWREAGCDDFLFEGCDVVAVLDRALAVLEAIAAKGAAVA